MRGRERKIRQKRLKKLLILGWGAFTIILVVAVLVGRTLFQDKCVPIEKENKQTEADVKEVEANVKEVEVDAKENEDDAKEVEVDANEIIVDTKETEEVNYDAYSEIINLYATAEKEKWDMIKLEEEKLSLLPFWEYSGTEVNSTGYCLVDLNQDGIKELLIGSIKEDEDFRKIIFDAYTLKDERAEKLFESAERNRYYAILEDGSYIIANEGSNSAANSANFYYSFDGEKLNVIQGIIMDGQETGEETYYMTYEDSWDISNAELMNIQAAYDMMKSYSERYVSFDYVPVE